MLLIVSIHDDVHAQSVRRTLGDDRCLIWNPDWDDKLTLAVEFGNEPPNGGVRTGQGVIDMERISAVWYRRPISAMPRRLFRTESYFVARERDDGLEALLLMLQLNKVPVYNMPSANYASTAKPLQYSMATGCGLKIPDTLITNSPAAVRNFLAGHERCILKGVSLSGLETDDKHYAVFVHEINDEILASMDHRLPQCPVTVQELIDWSSAARILIIDEQIWCFTTDRADRLDWRTDLDANWRLSRIPSGIESSLIKLHRSMNLRYGCVDMLIDASGVWWFLETNANGQWLWLEEASGYPLSRNVGLSFLDR